MGHAFMQQWLLEDFGLDVVELSPVTDGADISTQVLTAIEGPRQMEWSGTSAGRQVAV